MDIQAWIVPSAPSLEELSFKASESHGAVHVEILRALGGGIVLNEMPPFSAWMRSTKDEIDLVLLQARELGSLVPHARIQPFTKDWIHDIDLVSIHQTLSAHPDLNKKSLNLSFVHIAKNGHAHIRSFPKTNREVILAVLNKVSIRPDWSEAQCIWL